MFSVCKTWNDETGAAAGQSPTFWQCGLIRQVRGIHTVGSGNGLGSTRVNPVTASEMHCLYPRLCLLILFVLVNDLAAVALFLARYCA